MGAAVIDIKKELMLSSRIVGDELERILSESDPDYASLSESMRYSTLSGGKRIRSFLTVSFCALFGGRREAALPFACAAELIHCFSLIHDDLPCMDDDDLRRGKPTNHKKYGEAVALLSGDALSILAFRVAASNREVSPAVALEAVRLLSDAAGRDGMVGGQVMDMRGETEEYGIEKLKKLQSLKTGAMIKVSSRLGAIAAGVTEDDGRYSDASSYADKLGLAFQVVDDILDVTSTASELGKSCGSDEKNGKTTFVSLMGVDGARACAEKLTAEAVSYIEKYEGGQTLAALAEYLLYRRN